MMSWLATLVAALIGGMSGGFLAPWAKARFDRRHERHQAFDRAITAVKAVLYAYTAPSHVDRSHIGDSTYAQEFADQLLTRRVERFFEATYGMRQAIAELEPHYKVVWNPDQFQLTEEELKHLVDQLKMAR
ncbi:hypothetical protein [Streptomyces collinus]|uniref:Uncharacterized protein n=1 Tax=Streptomyces collinus TaxID=42684 RepID=A0AA89Q1K6_STRCU|nr:hypothetical protein [Streptomyces collinus]MBB5812746.1 hypothetical protein [Streptomyces collinus]WMX65879.1 hypothetical protein RFN52_22005 [Streptomyces collinus]